MKTKYLAVTAVLAICMAAPMLLNEIRSSGVFYGVGALVLMRVVHRRTDR